jgi:hypothetical protein
MPGVGEILNLYLGILNPDRRVKGAERMPGVSEFSTSTLNVKP